MRSAIDLHSKPSADFEAKLAETHALLQRAARDHSGRPGDAEARVTQASSLGAEDMVISHLIDTLALEIPIFVLETGMLHDETLQLLEQLRETARSPVHMFRPQQEAVVQFVAREGKEAMYRSVALRKACCDIRKMEPLERALAGKDAWITGLRREQSGARAEVPPIDRGQPTRLKYNPLAAWTWGDVWHYISAYQVAYNPLHDQFYPSIGCAPCTRAISLGEDFRAGRWWWEQSDLKECGLHAGADHAASSVEVLSTASSLSMHPAPAAERSPA